MRHALSVALCALALGVSSVLAQSGDARTDAPIHVGPFYITPVFQLSRLGVETNVFNTSGEQSSDFTVAAGPRVDIAVPLRQFVFTAKTMTEFVYFRQFANQRGVNFDMTLRGEVRLPRFSLFVEDSFLDTRQRPNFEIDVRARRKVNDGRVGVSIEVFRKLDVELFASQSTSEYAGDDAAGARLARVLNRDGVAAGGTVEYAVTPLTTVRLSGEARAETFALAPGRDNNSWRIVPGVQFHPRAIISGNAELGYRSLRGTNAALPPFDGLVASVDVSFRLLGSSTVGFTATRDVEFSFQVLEPYFVGTGYGVSFRHQLSALFAVRLSMQRDNYGYRQFLSTESQEAVTAGKSNNRRYSVTLYRRLRGDTEIGFDVAHASRRSNRTVLGQYAGLTAGLTTTYAF